MVVLLALAKIGVVTALINCNLTDEGLSHSINIAKCRGCVYQHKLENVLAKVATNLMAPIDKSPFQVITSVQCNPDLVTSYLVTKPDLVTILQKTIFLLHKNISFSDNLVFSAPSI